MKKLKRLLETGGDKELLNYLRNDFRWKVDKYISMENQIRQLSKDYMRLSKDSEARSAKINDVINRANEALAYLDTVGSKS